MPKCSECHEDFVWNDEVVIVNNECYHKDCVTLVPTGYVALIGDEVLGEIENDDGNMAYEIFHELLNDD